MSSSKKGEMLCASCLEPISGCRWGLGLFTISHSIIIDVYCLYMFHPVLSVKHLHAFATAFASNLKPCQEKLETLTGQLWYATRVYFMCQHPPSSTRHTRIRKSHKITISPGPMAVAQLCCIHHNSHLSGLNWRADVAQNAQKCSRKTRRIWHRYGTFIFPVHVPVHT